MALRWYVAQCMPRYEAWAVKNVLQQANEGFGVYWPRYEAGKSRGRNYQRGLFPGYLFVSFDAEYDNWKKLCSTFGIRKLLGCSDYVTSPLPTGFVETMMADASDGLIKMPSDAAVQYNPGDKLKIVDGPLAGHVGILKYSEKGRVALLLSLLGGQNQVILPIDRVQYAGAPL